MSEKHLRLRKLEAEAELAEMKLAEAKAKQEREGARKMERWLMSRRPHVSSIARQMGRR